MCRAVTLVFLLAAIAAVSAYAAEASATKTHRKALGAHPGHHHAATAAHHRSNAERPSPDEVGRAAGLKIRREMAQRSVSERVQRTPERLRHTRYARASRFRRARAVPAVLHKPVAAPRIESDGPSPLPQAAEAASQPATGESAALRREDSVLQPSGETSPQPTGENKAVEGSAEPPAVEGSEVDEASLYIPHGAMPAALRGSLESLERQNDRLTADGLERIENEDDLAARIKDGLLVPVPASAALTVNSELPPNHRYCRPWTARFLRDLAAAHDSVFHRPLEVSSAVRPETYQRRLMRTNGNAAPAEGDVVSPHMTGAAVDIAKGGLTREEVGWMRNRLAALEAEGKIDVEEEFHQACFHITVYKSYAPPRAVHRPSEAKEPQAAPEPATDGAQGL
jgi:hypothetical protein